jgi:hypothetical protein
MRPTAHTLVSQLEQIGPPTDPPHNDSLEEGLDESVPPSDSVDLKPPPQISPPCTEILQQPMNPIEGETTKENVIHSTSPELPSKNQIDSIGPLTLATSNAIQQQDLQNMLSSLGPTSNE